MQFIAKALSRITRPRAFRGPYKDFQSAARHCTVNSYASSEALASNLLRAAAIHDSILKGRIRTADMTAAMIYRAVLSLSNEPAVLDFGGGFGKYYEIIRRTFDVDPTYHIVELPDKVHAAIGASNKKLYFNSHHDVPKITYSHLILGAVLQTLPEPRDTLSHILRSVNSEFVYIARLPISKRHDNDQVFIKRQKDNGRIPYTVFGRDFVAALDRIGDRVATFDSVGRTIPDARVIDVIIRRPT